MTKEDDLEQQMLHESDDDMEYDPSNVEFIEWLASKNFNYKTIDHYTMKALWIYWARGDDEVKLTDKESSNSEDEDEVAKFFRIETNVFDFRHLYVGPSRSLIIFYKSIQMYLLKILKALRLTKIIRMIEFTNGTKMYHGCMKNHGWMMEHGKNPLQLSIIVSLLIIKMDVRNGQPTAGGTMDIVMEETYLKLT
nr:C2 calcium/lipid-binding domain, CaLB [Tanacetum cinerariifolium]